MNIGMILGRFQVFHNGHLTYLLKAKEYCDFMIIGITNPDPIRMQKTKSAIHRDEIWANPLTYYERMKMLQKVCEEYHIGKENYDIVPIPLDVPEIIKYYIPEDILIMVTIHDDWSIEKKKRLENEGYKVKVILDEYGLERLSSTEIRKYIADGKQYSHCVPVSVYEYLCDNALDQKIREALEMA